MVTKNQMKIGDRVRITRITETDWAGCEGVILSEYRQNGYHWRVGSLPGEDYDHTVPFRSFELDVIESAPAPNAEVPRSLKSAPWVAVYDVSEYDTKFNHSSMCVSAEATLSLYGLCIGALNVLTGEWVPR